MKLRISFLLLAFSLTYAPQVECQASPRQIAQRQTGVDIAQVRFRDIDANKLKALASKMGSRLYPANRMDFIKSTSEQDRIAFCVKLNTKVMNEYVSAKGFQVMRQIKLSKSQGSVELLPVTTGEQFAKQWWQKKLGKQLSKRWMDCCMYYAINLLAEDNNRRWKLRQSQTKSKKLAGPGGGFMDFMLKVQHDQFLASRVAVAQRFKKR